MGQGNTGGKSKFLYACAYMQRIPESQILTYFFMASKGAH